MKPYKIILLLFLLGNCSESCIYSQSVNYVPNEVFIKWKPTANAHQRWNNEIRHEVNQRKRYKTLALERWELKKGADVLDIIQQYKDHPAIEFIEPNYIYKSFETIPSDPMFNDQWALKNTGQNQGTPNADIKATFAWEIQKESPNIKVAIIDTGIDWKHPDLIDNIWQNLAEDSDGDGAVLEWNGYEWTFDPDDMDGIDNDGNGYIDDFIGWDFRNDDNNPYDEDGHGTHVAGIVGARGDNAIGISGVTREVQMVALKVIEQGHLKISDAIEAINYAVTMGIPISNNSWGGSIYSAALFSAIQSASTEDHLFVAAVGNDNLNTDVSLIYPASFPLDNIISVAASNKFDAPSDFSNYGAITVDLHAPGSAILSCLPNNSYGIRNGTSQAAPLVTGASALLKELFPDKTALEIKTAIINSVDPIASLNDKSISGGRLNLFNLLSESGVNCAYRDSLALVALYHSTGGSNWVNTWDLNQPMNTWYGITTNANGCVIAIDLDNNQLQGIIPAAIRNLYSLESLSLSNNQLIGNIPSTIGKLENLIHLQLDNNFLTGNIPSEIGYLIDLKYLHLNHNQLTGELPIALGQLEDIIHLQLNNNQLDGSIPELFNRLNDLKKLYLNDNQFSGFLPGSLVSSSRLEWLYLNNNQLTGSVINIQFLFSIRKLYLHDNQLTGSIPSQISNFYNIEELYLNDNQLSGSIPAEIGDLETLQKLHLENNQLTGCFSQNFSTLCGIDYNFSGNSELPGGGAFTDFCTNQIGECLSCKTVDSLALVALYNTTNGAGWTTTWDLYTPINTWYGVEVNSDGCVIEIDLKENQLTDSLPAEIGNFKNLEFLDLGGNQLMGNIPTEIGNLSNLVRLDLFDNHLSGLIPVSIGNLSNLQLLSISNNNLSGSIPAEIGNLKNLDYLGIGSNQLTGSIPASMGNLANLRILGLGANQLSGSIPATLGNLTNLTSLQLLVNQLTGSIPPELGNLKKLTSLNLYHNQLTGSVPLEIFNLKNLGGLDLSSNQLTGNIPYQVRELENLYSLYLGNNQLSGIIPSSIGQLQNLAILSLKKNQLTGTIPEWVGNLTNLERLYLSYNQLTGGIPPAIGNLDKLQILQLNNNHLEGCFPETLLNLCTIYDTDFSGNPKLPNGGDFDSFCANESGMCIAPVWPGDFNNDGVANNTDALYWGLACSDTPGPPRTNASTAWIGQEATDWTTSVQNVNSKHQDGDGNGLINEADLQVLIDNYGKTHGYEAFGNQTNGFNYSLVSQNIGGDTLEIALKMESDDEPINLHGMACSIDFGSLPIDTFNFDLSNSSLNASQHLITYDSVENTLDIALTRTDKIDTLCDGQMGVLWVVVADLMDLGNDILINVKNGSQMKANGNFNAVGGATLYSTYTLPPSNSNLLIDVSVAPVECDKLGSAMVNISGGVAPYDIAWNNGGETPIITGLTEGTYSVVVTDANGLEAVYEIEIEGKYIPEYDNDGELINCTPTACPPVLNLSNVIIGGLHQASDYISSTSTIDSGKTIILKAGTSITFQPGFTVNKGGLLLATIENCETTTNENASYTNFSNSTTIPNNVTKQTNLKSLTSNKTTLNLAPNPFKNQTMIFYELSEPAFVNLSIVSIEGTRIVNLEKEVYKKAGKYAIEYTKESLVKGVHFTQLQTNRELITRKMIVLE